MKTNAKLDAPKLVFDLNMRLRYVGIIRLFFMFFNLLLNGFTQNNFCCNR